MDPVIDQALDLFGLIWSINGPFSPSPLGRNQEKALNVTFGGQDGLKMGPNEIKYADFEGIQISPKLGLIGHLIKRP